MFKYLCILLVVGAAFAPTASAKELTAHDVRTLLAAMGINPGTTRQLGEKGLHTLLRIKVTGRKGHFKIILIEREVKPNYP